MSLEQQVLDLHHDNSDGVAGIDRQINDADASYEQVNKDYIGFVTDDNVVDRWSPERNTRRSKMLHEITAASIKRWALKNRLKRQIGRSALREE